MKNLKFCLLLFVGLLMSSAIHAQKLKLVSGNLKPLKGERVLKVEYNYDNMAVGKFKSEDDYLAKKTKELNENEAGRGDDWAIKWKEDRAKRFQPKFEKLMNTYLKKVYVKIDPNKEDTKYTMIVNTVFTEPGYNIAISQKPALINLEIIFVETANHDKKLGKITLFKAPGVAMGGASFDTGSRIQEAYAKAGKELAKYLLKIAYK